MPLHILDPYSVKLDFPDGIEKVHCGSCNLDVIDFTKFTEQDLKVYFSTKSAGRVCGRIIKQSEVNYKVEIIQVLQKVQQTKLFSFRLLFITCFALLSCTETKKEKVENQIDTTIILNENEKVDGVVEKINEDSISLKLRKVGKKVEIKGRKKKKKKEIVAENKPQIILDYIPNDSINQVISCGGSMPTFPGGEMELIRYLDKNLKVPDSNYLPKERSAVVYVDFVVDKTGKVMDVKIRRGFNKQCDEAALNLIRSLPNFIPDIRYGEPVNVQYTFPIRFKPLSQNKL